MTTNEAAAELGLAPATVRKQIELGALTATKAGRDWSISRRAVEQYRASRLGRPGRKVQPAPRSRRNRQETAAIA